MLRSGVVGMMTDDEGDEVGEWLLVYAGQFLSGAIGMANLAQKGQRTTGSIDQSI